MMNPRWTIGICTWNRSDLLQRTLASIASLNGLGVAADPVEVLVVNNGSTDNTADILANTNLPCDFRCVLETKLGHTHARNRLIKEARGETILWTDDDVLLDANWLQEYQSVIKSKKQESFWGGPIRPTFLGRRPRWLKRNYQKLAGCFAERDLGNESFPISETSLPYGANFAVRTAVARANPFNIRLGRRGKGCVGEDERDFLKRLLDQGLIGSWVPNAKVQHLIPPERASLSYISSYFAGQAEVQWLAGNAPNWSVTDLEKAAADHRFWFHVSRWTTPSRVWLEHLTKAAQFARWAELKNGGRA